MQDPRVLNLNQQVLGVHCQGGGGLQREVGWEALGKCWGGARGMALPL